MGKRSNNYIYFKRDWFNNLVDNKYDIEMYYDFCEMSLTEFADKIKERNKAKKDNKEEINIFEDGDTNYLRIARMHLITEPTTTKEMACMMIAQYINAQCPRDKKNKAIKVIKFETLERVFKMSSETIGALLNSFGGDYYLSIASKQERVGRPKKVFYAVFNNDDFMADYIAIGDNELVDEKDNNPFGKADDVEWN